MWHIHYGMMPIKKSAIFHLLLPKKTGKFIVGYFYPLYACPGRSVRFEILKGGNF